MYYEIFKIICKFILVVFFRLKSEGKDNIPTKSNYIVIANHTSFLDPVIVSVCFSQKIYWLAARDLYKIPFLKWFFNKSGAFSVGSASKYGESFLNSGKNVGVFPEGICSRDGKLKTFRTGAVLLAYKTGRPIVPCIISGAYEALPWGNKIPKFKKLRLKIGKPVYFLKETEEKINDIRLQKGVEALKSVMEELFYG